MTWSGIELVRSERRRRWTRAEKERPVAASFEPGVSTSDVAREAGLHVSQLFRWRKLLCERVVPPAPVPTLLPVSIVPASSSTPAEPRPRRLRTRRLNGVIESELAGGRRLTFGRDVDAAALRRVLDALEGR